MPLTGYSQRRREQQEQIAETIARLKAMFTQAELQESFAKRKQDHEFEALGRIALRHRHNYQSVPQHIFIWTGYEMLTNSKFTLIDYFG
jgi:hypothetical protein